MAKQKSVFKKALQEIAGFIFPDDYKKALIRVIILTVLVFIIAMILENINCLDGKFMSDFFEEHLKAHVNGKQDGYYSLYYIILYMGIVMYVASALYICVRKNTKGWCALLMLISIIFLIAVDEWLTITLGYDDTARLYDKHMLCYICVATIINGITAARLVGIIKSEQNKNSTGKQTVKNKKNGKK